MSRRVFFYLLLTLLFSACGNKGRDTREDTEVPELYEIYDLTAEAESWADSVSKKMTLRQKIAQLFMPAVYASDDYWTVRRVREYADSCIGGILLLKGDTLGARSLADSALISSLVRPFIAIDAEWGLAMRLTDAPRFPANSNIGPGADDQLMYDYGREIARECRQLGINMVLGPVVDVSGPDSFMLRRSFGDDPKRVADLAIAYARGLEDGDVVSVAKHFPGHGSVSSDSHKTKGVIMRSLNEMDSTDLYPFNKWVEQKLSGIMVGHLAVPSIDSKLLPAAVSPTVITDLLREDLGYNGLILTDAINMKGAEGYSAMDALLAGADIMIAPADTHAEINRILTAVENGEIEESLIDSRVKKILFYKYLFGLDTAASPVGGEGVKSPVADSLSVRLRY